MNANEVKNGTRCEKILYASDIEKGSRPAFRAAVSLCGHYDAQITWC